MDTASARGGSRRNLNLIFHFSAKQRIVISERSSERRRREANEAPSTGEQSDRAGAFSFSFLIDKRIYVLLIRNLLLEIFISAVESRFASDSNSRCLLAPSGHASLHDPTHTRCASVGALRQVRYGELIAQRCSKTR